MKVFFIVLFGFSMLFGAAEVVKVEERFSDSQSCKACHLRIVNEWKDSWHSKSHYKNDEYFQKSLDYVSRKTRKSLNSVKVQCATCHNPRISVTSTDQDYEIDAVLGLDKDSEVNKAVNDNAISEGINCVVCHNIDKIHDSLDASKRGINRVSWTESGTMTGPYKDAKSPYHKTVHHEFMDKEPNKLCFVCHANDTSVKGLVFTNMEKEYKKGSKSCVECHMGKKRKDVAATYKMYNGKAKMRDVRHHGFAGAHSSSMWRDALNISLAQKSQNIMVHIKNPQPHNIPSGFGSRELIVEIFYKKGLSIIGEKKISLTRTYTRKRNKPTIPHLAKKQSKDMSIPAEGKKILKVAKMSEATSVEVKLYYRLVNDEVRNLLKLKGANWSEKYFISEANMKLKK
ncbi:MAG: multiheme c-type cytochrome [Campylobacterota bacterium]|nr:multiheme c-type cytochrome [Campylobacterota bacterium]